MIAVLFGVVFGGWCGTQWSSSECLLIVESAAYAELDDDSFAVSDSPRDHLPAHSRAALAIELSRVCAILRLSGALM